MIITIITTIIIIIMIIKILTIIIIHFILSGLTRKKQIGTNIVNKHIVCKILPGRGRPLDCIGKRD